MSEGVALNEALNKSQKHIASVWGRVSLESVYDFQIGRYERSLVCMLGFLRHPNLLFFGMRKES